MKKLKYESEVQLGSSMKKKPEAGNLALFSYNMRKNRPTSHAKLIGFLLIKIHSKACLWNGDVYCRALVFLARRFRLKLYKKTQAQHRSLAPVLKGRRITFWTEFFFIPRFISYSYGFLIWIWIHHNIWIYRSHSRRGSIWHYTVGNMLRINE